MGIDGGKRRILFPERFAYNVC